VKLGFLIDRWQPSRGGAERALTRLASHLEGRGHEVLAFGERGPLPADAAPGRFQRVSARGLMRGSRERSLAEAMLAAAERAGCDLTIGVRHLPRVDVYWPHGGCHRATLELSGKRVTGRHRTFVELERDLLERGGARVVVCVSRLVRDEIVRHYPRSAARSILVPNGVDLERMAPHERAAARARLEAELGWPREGPHECPRIGFVGRNARLKGLDTLLAALARLVDRPWRLVVAGLRRPRAWERAARDAGLGARVVVREWVADLDLAAGVDLCVLPTRRDPCPLSVLEALACGTPVITTARAGCAEAIRPGRDGEVLADPEDSDALRAAVADWLERVRSGAVDPGAVRSCVEDRGIGAWLARMERAVLEAAERRAVR